VDPPTVKQINQAINTHMQTTHNQSRYPPARTWPPVQSGSRYVNGDDRCPAGDRTGQCRGLASRYATDVLEGRALVAEETEWGQAVRSSRPMDSGPRGIDQAGSSIPSVSHVMANEGPPPSATGPRIITVSLPTHRDIQDHTLDALWHAPPSAFCDVLVLFLGLDQRAVDRMHMGPLLAALLHTLVRQGEAVRTWTEGQVGVSTGGAADHLDRFGRDALPEVVLPEVDTAEAGNSRRGHAGRPSCRGQARAREDAMEGDQAGPAQRYRSGLSSWW